MTKLDDFVLLCHPHCFWAVNKGIWEKSEKESDDAESASSLRAALAIISFGRTFARIWGLKKNTVFNLSLVKYLYLYIYVYVYLDIKMVREIYPLCLRFILKWIGCEPLAQTHFLEVKIQLIYWKNSWPSLNCHFCLTSETYSWVAFRPQKCRRAALFASVLDWTP